MAALDKKLLRDALHFRGQLIAVAMVVFCGLTVFVSMRATYDSLRITQAEYYRTYRFADVFAQVKRAPESLRSQLQTIQGVATVDTRVVVQVTLDVPGLPEPATGRIVSVPSDGEPLLNGVFLRHGNTIRSIDRGEVLVSEAFASANGLHVGDSIGAILNSRWRELRIVGIALSPEYIYEVPGGASLFPDNRRFGVLWMAREELGSAFDLEGAFNDIAISLAPGASEPAVLASVDRILEPYGGLGAYGRDENLSHRFITDEIAQQEVTQVYLPAVFLGLAAFLLHIVLSRLIGTQRNEIAMLKAFGYANSAIAVHYVEFALVPVAMGTVTAMPAGLWLASAMTGLYQQFYRFPILRFEVTAELIVLALALGVAAAIAGAIVAVRQAARLQPADAMRPESPPRFKPLIVERLGLERLFPASVRMILRNIERRPVKSFMSVLGVAAAVALLIVGRFFFDSFEHLLSLQFDRIQREDVTVAFNEPAGPAAEFDLLHLPGVLHSEPFRVVPVRLRAGHTTKRTAVFGLDSRSRLRNLIDRDLSSQQIPAGGLLMTTKLGEVLGVAPGDRITIEVLEGSRRTTSVQVVRFVDELLGTALYMERADLNRLTGDGDTLSGAFLSVDPRELDHLYRELKTMPRVSGVTVRASAIESIQTTIQESMGMSMGVIIIFACVIAVGVVYNGARIALSERGRELASLRVLGFTKREVAVMLLGEQAILTAVSIPVGFVAGVGLSALLTWALDTELYRLPLVISDRSFAISFIVVLCAAFVSGLLVSMRIEHLDLIEVLKTRE